MQPSDEMVEAAASVLLGRVNAPEQEIYRAARAALAAALAQGNGGVGVKALEWEDAALFISNGWMTLRLASTPFGLYAVDHLYDSQLRVTLTGQTLANCAPASISEAEAAAQADYEARIRSSLTPSPAQAGAEHRYAEMLLIALMENHYPDRSPKWAPLPDLMGILTQIDNLTTGLVRASPPTSEPTDQQIDAALHAWHGTPVKDGDERQAMKNALRAGGVSSPAVRGGKWEESPLSRPFRDDGSPEWMQIERLFERFHAPAPDYRLRDELVVLLSWARFGERIHDRALPAAPTAGGGDAE